ncbi:hypothetical protein DVA76_18395, partial [Acinetobacter baumannii]
TVLVSVVLSMALISQTSLLVDFYFRFYRKHINQMPTNPKRTASEKSNHAALVSRPALEKYFLL